VANPNPGVLPSEVWLSGLDGAEAERLVLALRTLRLTVTLTLQYC